MKNNSDILFALKNFDKMKEYMTLINDTDAALEMVKIKESSPEMPIKDCMTIAAFTVAYNTILGELNRNFNSVQEIPLKFQEFFPGNHFGYGMAQMKHTDGREAMGAIVKLLDLIFCIVKDKKFEISIFRETELETPILCIDYEI